MRQKFHIIILFLFVGFLGYAQGPQAGFIVNGDTNASLVRVCNGYSVDFFNNSTGVPTSFDWQFQGGTPPNSTNVNPVVAWEVYQIGRAHV